MTPEEQRQRIAIKAAELGIPLSEMIRASKTQIHEEVLPPLVISDLLAAGFRFEPTSGAYWHWKGSHGIEMRGGKWFPCEMLSNGNLWYSDEGFESPVNAAKQAVLKLAMAKFFS